jgi:hypothetical protein
MSDTVNAPRRPRSARMIAFYNQCRHWHGYLSAFAFLALIFFSATGILLNHPEWLNEEEADPVAVTAQLPQGEITSALASADPGAALGLLAAGHMTLLGAYSSADIGGGEAFLRFESVKGSSDVSIDLKSGAARGRVRAADMLTVLDDLHRGKNVGAAWRWVIDLAGVIVLLLSLVGYVLFFMFRFRLRVGLALTAISLVAMVAIFILFVP